LFVNFDEIIPGESLEASFFNVILDEKTEESCVK
jgi:hypothetical protein